MQMKMCNFENADNSQSGGTLCGTQPSCQVMIRSSLWKVFFFFSKAWTVYPSLHSYFKTTPFLALTSPCNPAVKKNIIMQRQNIMGNCFLRGRDPFEPPFNLRSSSSTMKKSSLNQRDQETELCCQSRCFCFHPVASQHLCWEGRGVGVFALFLWDCG